MQLSDKIHSLTSETVVRELSLMLPSAQVTISWWGERLVSIDGFVGSIETNKIAAKFLDAEVLGSRRERYPTITERFTCCEVWEKLRLLYEESDRKRDATWFCGYLTSAKDLRESIQNPPVIHNGNPRAIIQEENLEFRREASLLAFTHEDFELYWPGQKPASIVSYGFVQYSIVTDEMLKQLHVRMKRAIDQRLHW